MAHQQLALELASTIRHDGHGGVTDDLASTSGFITWLTGQAELLGDVGMVDAEEVRPKVCALRGAIRSLLARAVAPRPPSKADAHRLLDPTVALAEVNAAAALPRVPSLDWPTDGEPTLRFRTDDVEPEAALLAALARAVIEFLAGGDRARLRACPAPRCVRYFLQDHPRQAWCKPSCGNRARVSRYYQRHHED
ncbi:MAG TPA: ABATE domain-containing protein [Pseudonocardiaceae bacterium]|jgi:predicted RNA-binding Zn ribbon-like protein|nr:ABATE domain-containing protein [Pseudonocardiaceae bacterium]